MSHISYPQSGTFESSGPCPASHPVKVPQLFFEAIWDTTAFNDQSLWPTDGSQPFIWSFGDETGYGNHGDYVFGWKGDSLQRAMDANCNVNCPTLKSQSLQQGNQCKGQPMVNEEVDACKLRCRPNDAGTSFLTSIAGLTSLPGLGDGALTKSM